MHIAVVAFAYACMMRGCADGAGTMPRSAREFMDVALRQTAARVALHTQTPTGLQPPSATAPRPPGADWPPRREGNAARRLDGGRGESAAAGGGGGPCGGPPLKVTPLPLTTVRTAVVSASLASELGAGLPQAAAEGQLQRVGGGLGGAAEAAEAADAAAPDGGSLLVETAVVAKAGEQVPPSQLQPAEGVMLRCGISLNKDVLKALMERELQTMQDEAARSMKGARIAV